MLSFSEMFVDLMNIKNCFVWMHELDTDADSWKAQKLNTQNLNEVVTNLEIGDFFKITGSALNL